MNVYLTEKSGSAVASELLGIFSDPERARKVCQDSADEFFGHEHTPPLNWLSHANGGYSSASYQHPEAGRFLFQITMVVVDEVMS